MTELTTAQILAQYNEYAEKLGEAPVKRFADRKTAERRLAAIIERMPPEAPAVEAPAVEAPAVDAPAVEAPAVDAPAVEAPAPKKVVAPGRGRKTQFDLTRKLVVNIDPTRPTNPKQKNSRSFKIFEIYGTLPTLTGEKFVAAVVAAGYPRRLALSSLHWDMEHGFIHFADFAA